MIRLLLALAGCGLLALAALTLLPVHAQAPTCRVCLSQIYAGGGKEESAFNADFVELFNPTAASQPLAGWHLNYAAMHSEQWAAVDLSPLTLAPFSYALVALAQGEVGAQLPAPDLQGDLNLNSTGGKLQIVDTANIQADLVGYGGADYAEGAPVDTSPDQPALWRLQDGCRDSDNNAADFTPEQPQPRNSQSPTNPCPDIAPEQSPTPTAALSPDTPDPTAAATGALTETVAETPTALPPPTAVEEPPPAPLATADLSLPSTLTPDPALDGTPLPQALPSETATAPPAETAIEPPTLTAAATPSLTATPTPAPTATPTTAPTPLPRILISELLIDPDAAPDAVGEWVELYNPNAWAVDLQGWLLADGGSDRHIIGAALWIAPDGYLVVGASADREANGGAPVAYQYSGVTLANQEDELRLLGPDAQLVDAVAWGEARGLAVPSGAGLERITLAEPAAWAAAAAPWPGSWGDYGSPGAAYSPPLPTATPAVIALPTAALEATPSPAITPIQPAFWAAGSTPSPLQIEEIDYSGSDAEYIVLLNVGSEAISLAGWLLGDAESPGKSEGMYALPDTLLPPGGLYSVARQAEAFHNRFGRWPDATVEEATAQEAAAAAVQLAPRKELAPGQLALNDSGDEVVLLGPGLLLADAVAYGSGNYAALHLSGELQAAAGDTLQRVPGALFPTTADVRQRFLSAPPRPFDVRGLPLGAPPAAVVLDEGYLALWGTLGAHSNFTRGFSAPPHYLLAAAAAQGLQFVAAADDGVCAPPLQVPAGMSVLPAWRWQGDGAAQAVVYNALPVANLSFDGLADYLADHSGAVQWQGKGDPCLGSLSALDADDIHSEDLPRLFDRWHLLGVPWLPAGNAEPDLPGVVTASPRYTGLAVRSQDADSLLEAVGAARGWMTSDRNLWLTLRAEQAGGGAQWMGSWLAAANQVTLFINYGDLDGEAASLALWQDGAPLQQLLLPPADGRWSLSVPAVPGAVLAAVATQTDGDFAVTAPFLVVKPPNGSVLINEVLPAPGSDADGDANKDGKTNSQDEFIELWNPNAEPVALGGWQLVDSQGEVAGGHRYTFAATRLILGGEHLVLWRDETRLSLDDGGDSLRLLDAGGGERDSVHWDASLGRGRSLARIPDGASWYRGADVTPGQANRPGDGSPNEERRPPPNPNGDLPAVPTLEATYGQAGGPPGSVAQSKLAGLDAEVELRAVVTVPPNLFNGSIYVADVAEDGATAGIGVMVYLHSGDFPPLVEGDRVWLHGRWDSYRGEMELVLAGPQDIWKLDSAAPAKPLPVQAHTVCEAVEGRLVTLHGAVAGWQGDSLLLVDEEHPASAPLRVTVRSSLAWKRPFVHKGEVWQVTGVVSQFARKAPWNDGYRVLVRYPSDLVRIE